MAQFADVDLTLPDTFKGDELLQVRTKVEVVFSLKEVELDLEFTVSSFLFEKDTLQDEFAWGSHVQPYSTEIGQKKDDAKAGGFGSIGFTTVRPEGQNRRTFTITGNVSFKGTSVGRGDYYVVTRILPEIRIDMHDSEAVKGPRRALR